MKNTSRALMKKSSRTALAAAIIFAAAPFQSQNVLAAPWGNEPHHLVMQSHHDLIRENINNPYPAIRICAETASRALNINDPGAAKGPQNVTAWIERNGIMTAYATCLGAAKLEAAAEQRLGGHNEHQLQIARDYNEISANLNSDNPNLQTCARQAQAQLGGNDWHANLGYANIAAWNKRKEIMHNYRRCIVDAAQGRNVSNNQELNFSDLCGFYWVYDTDSNTRPSTENCNRIYQMCLRYNDAWANWDPGNTGSQIHRAAADANRRDIESGYRQCMDKVAADENRR